MINKNIKGNVQTILSLQNPLIKKIKNLSKKNNEKSKEEFISEGEFFLKEAIHFKWNISHIFCNVEKKDKFLKGDFFNYFIKSGTSIIFVNEKILKYLSQKNNPQDFLFTAKKKKFTEPKNIMNNHFSQ